MEYRKKDNRRILRDGTRTKASVRGEHRVVIEEVIGMTLSSNEIVHHKNGDKRDNRPENLEITTRSEHAKMHARERWDHCIPCRVCSSPTVSKLQLCHKHSTIQGMWARKRGGKTGDWLDIWISKYKPREVIT